MKYFFIFNPGSRNGQSKRLISRIHGLLKNKKVNYEYDITKSLQDAYFLSQKANSASYDTVVAVGGDGTINKVLNGFYDDNGLRTSKARFGVIYTGTSPDFCKSYRIQNSNIERAIDVLLAGKTTKIQIGKIILAAKMNSQFNGKPMRSGSDFITRYFSCCANIGLGAAVARYANSGVRKVAGDHLGTFISLLKAFMSYRPSNLTVSLDGKQIEIPGLCNLSVGKTFYVASGIKVKNELKEGDDRFYTLIVKNVGWTKVSHCLQRIYSGKEIRNSDNVCLNYAHSVEIYGDRIIPEVEFDGDPQGFLPCQIEMAKDKLELIYEEGK